MRYRAILEYDGTEFLGFQRQAQGRTVQGEVESALRQVGWTGTSIWAAGRTDTGVHASGQVIAFDLEWRHGLTALTRALNAHLPADAAVKVAEECAVDFHPRYHARARRYRYSIYNRSPRSPLKRLYAWQIPHPVLDVEAMQQASAQLVGQHDFAAFGTDPDDGENTVRNISEVVWERQGDWVYFEIQADAFLYRMVRSLVGALKRVGTGELIPVKFTELLATRDRAQCPPIAPAHGLCLMEVIY